MSGQRKSRCRECKLSLSAWPDFSEFRDHIPSPLAIVIFHGYFHLVLPSAVRSLFLPTVQGYYQGGKKGGISVGIFFLNFHQGVKNSQTAEFIPTAVAEGPAMEMRPVWVSGSRGRDVTSVLQCEALPRFAWWAVTCWCPPPTPRLLHSFLRTAENDRLLSCMMFPFPSASPGESPSQHLIHYHRLGQSGAEGQQN